MNWVVEYDGYKIKCIAKNKRSAKYKAWMKYTEAYKIKFIDFLKGVTSVHKDSEIEE